MASLSRWHRRSACSLSMHVLTTAPFPHRYCTSPIRVLGLARLSRRLTVTGSGEKTLSKTRRGPRGGSQSWFAASLAPPAGLQPMSREICGFQARMMRTFARLQEITIPFRGLRRQTHPPSHPPYAAVMRPSQNLEHENETQLRAARPSRCCGLPVVRALSQTCLAAAVSAVTHLDSLSGRGFIMPRDAIVMISARSALSCSESAKEQPTPKVAKPSAGAPPVWLAVRLRRASERR